jgi:DNA-binding transcriptional ArsR family regulator
MKPMNIDACRLILPRVASLLKVLANEDRILLLTHLAHAECDVGQLEATLRIAQPTLSRQLGVLRHTGLVVTRRVGRNVYYRTAVANALAFVALIDALYWPSADKRAGRSMSNAAACEFVGKDPHPDPPLPDATPIRQAFCATVFVQQGEEP